MCGFYDDEQKIKKGDRAIYKSEYITVISAKHVTKNETMNIVYKIDDKEEETMINIPYKTAGFDLQLIQRTDKK
ncbi:hypothetical protein [Sulfurimonas sp.]|uniref:hypothetical protein n=1 Tax=Sulfurimonas sp. TaxID=2022749 RepID=UPI0025EDCCFF|nr:hypothetical protein [Sulfurimonas sp.]